MENDIQPSYGYYGSHRQQGAVGIESVSAPTQIRSDTQGYISTAALTGRQIISQPKMHMPILTRTQLSMDGSYRPPRSTIAIPRHQVLFRVHILFITLESCQQLVSASNIVDYWPVQVNEC
jgi:hypothetical protein